MTVDIDARALQLQETLMSELKQPGWIALHKWIRLSVEMESEVKRLTSWMANRDATIESLNAEAQRWMNKAFALVATLEKIEKETPYHRAALAARDALKAFRA